jgi:hypothetical protein
MERRSETMADSSRRLSPPLSALRVQTALDAAAGCPSRRGGVYSDRRKATT